MTEKERKPTNPDEEIAEKLTPEDVDHALAIIKHFAGNGTVEIEDAATLIVRIEEGAKGIRFESSRLLQQQEERRLARREFLVGLRNWGIGLASTALVVRGGYFWFNETVGPSALERISREARIRGQFLEDKYTLGLEPSASSYSGWAVRYTRRNEISIPTNLTSDPLTPGTRIKFPATKLNKLEDTGIIINDHIRTTDGQPTGRLSIITSYTPPTTDNKGYLVAEKTVVGEEWVLRDKSSGDINQAVLAFENKSTNLIVYLSIIRSKAIENPTFQLQSYTLKQ